MNVYASLHSLPEVYYLIGHSITVNTQKTGKCAMYFFSMRNIFGITTCFINRILYELMYIYGYLEVKYKKLIFNLVKFIIYMKPYRKRKKRKATKLIWGVKISLT